MKRFVLALCLLFSLAGPAHADWRRAESEHFIVYSDGSERSLRDYTVKLERFEALLRSRFGESASTEFRKLPVYLVNDGQALRVAQPALPEGITGYYWSGDNDIFAILVRGRDDDILLHEYSHHFMAQRNDGQYPGWLREGFADYFATATVSDRGKATFAFPNPGRLQALQTRSWLAMDRLIQARGSFAITDRDERGMYYSQSWLLTHWILADAARVAALQKYLLAINAGENHVSSWREAFGMTPEETGTALRAYARGRIYYAEVELPPLNPSIDVTAMTPAWDDVILPLIDARNPRRTGVDGPALLETLRAAAVRHPDDPLALTALGRAEKQWGEEQAAEAALAAALERDPRQVEASLLIAAILTERADDLDDPAARTAARRQAQGHLAQALEADPSDYRIYHALAMIRRDATGYPNENDLRTWDIAVQLAPQVQSIRGNAAIAFMEAGDLTAAEALLAPVLNDPHGGPGAQQARTLMEEIRRRKGAAAETPAED